MKRKNLSGYGTETFTYNIETTENCYDVTVDVKFYIQAPDYNTYDSDQDFYGFTDVLDVDITLIERFCDNGEAQPVLISELPVEEMKEIHDKLDTCIEDQTLGEQ